MAKQNYVLVFVSNSMLSLSYIAHTATFLPYFSNKPSV